jgi:hypothetical protein
MAIYLIDYENTGVKGLAGIEKLREDDLVIIFYGPKTGSLPFDEHVKISSAVSHVEYIKTVKTAKNYLDFQLTTYLGFLVASTGIKEYTIISRDSGYDSVVDFWKSRGMKLLRKDAIAGSSASEKVTQRKETRRTGRRSQQNKAKEPMLPVPLNPPQTEPQITAQNAPSETEPPEEGRAEIRQMEEPQQEANEQPEQSVRREKHVKTVKFDRQEENEKKNQAAIEDKTEESAGQESKAPEKQEPKKRTSVPETVRKKIRHVLKNEKLQGGIYKQIYGCMLLADNKQAYNTALVKAFGQEEGNRFYKLSVPIFAEWMKS